MACTDAMLTMAIPARWAIVTWATRLTRIVQSTQVPYRSYTYGGENGDVGVARMVAATTTMATMAPSATTTMNTTTSYYVIVW